MSVDWFHLSPVILTDDLFFTYIGDISQTGTAATRQASYLAAEQMMMDELGTFLLPTTVTGTYMWPGDGGTIVLPHKYMNSINLVTPLSFAGTGTCGLDDNAGCGVIRNGVGYIDVFCVENYAKRYCGSQPIEGYYQVRVSYTAGLPTGVAANDKSLHMALAIVAEEVLGQITDPGSGPGGVGAPGIKSWSTLGYSETLQDAAFAEMTRLGTSARAQFAKRLIKHLKKKRALRFS